MLVLTKLKIQQLLKATKTKQWEIEEFFIKQFKSAIDSDKTRKEQKIQI